METTNDKLIETGLVNEHCFWELDLYTGEFYWSDGLYKLLGVTKPYLPTLEQLIFYFEPEQNIRPAFNRAIHQGIPFRLELPALTALGKTTQVCTLATPLYDDYGKCIAIKGTVQPKPEQAAVQKPDTIILDQAEEKQMMFENFAWIVSHNLRSHTSNLQMVLDSINQKTSSEEMLDRISSIKTISSNLNQTVGYLNTLIKI